jgi:hypothetical protein
VPGWRDQASLSLPFASPAPHGATRRITPAPPAAAKEGTVAAASWLKYAHLAFLSKPKCDRQLYRLVKREQLCRFVEVGIGSLKRSLALIEVAQRVAGDQKVHYTGLDWFDARTTDLAELKLKHTHQRLGPTSAAVRLVPGPPAASIAAAANALQNTDVLLISHLVEQRDLEPAWFYVPRMLHTDSIVLQESRGPDGMSIFSQLPLSEIAERAGRTTKRRAA